MYSDFLYKINSRFEEMPFLIKIACGATFGLGIFQLVALIFPVVSPKIEGVSISTPLLAILMSFIHIAVGWGIYNKKRWGMLFTAALPLFQYSILYLEIGLPSNEAFQLNLIMCLGWVIFWAGYYYLSNARSYYSNQNNA